MGVPLRYLLSLLLLPLFVLTACKNDITLPEMEPVEPPEAWAYDPYYPNAPFCEDVAPGGFVNGAFMVRLHSWWSHNDVSIVVTPNTTAEQRRLQAEVYSYLPGGEICRNMQDLVTWNIIGNLTGSPTTQFGFGPFQHGRIKQFDHLLLGGNGTDAARADIGPKQICCPVQAVAGTVWDQVALIASGW